MAAKQAAGVQNVLKKILYAILIFGFLLALLRVFNYDPFGVVSMIFDWFSYAVNGIADFFTGNRTFREVASGPK